MAAAGANTTPEQRPQVELAAAADGRRAVAYYDLTFSASKSVSVYYAALLAAGDVEGAAAVGPLGRPVPALPAHPVPRSGASSPAVGVVRS